MQRPDEDQPNRELPLPLPLPTRGQHWRVQVPTPDTTLLLGQRVPDGGAHDPAFGYPGVSLSTRAGFFADVHERTVWQGREVIAFQSLWNVELHGGHAAVLGATRWQERDCEAAAGEYVGRTRAQGRLYAQLREQTLWMQSELVVREVLGAAKTLVNFPFAPTIPVKVLGLTANAAGVGLASDSLRRHTPEEVEPVAGVHITSHDGIFMASDGGTNVYTHTGFNVMSGTSFNAHANLTATVAAKGAVDVFGLAVATISSTLATEVVALRNSAVIAKVGTASVLGKQVQIGSQTHGPEILKNVKSNPLYLRPTETLKLAAVKSIEASVAGKFVVNAPLGEVSSTSRKAAVEAVESVTLKTPFGKVEVTATGISIAGPAANVKVTPMSVEITGGAAKVVVGPAGVNVKSPGAAVNVMPGGVVSVQGTVVKLG